MTRQHRPARAAAAIGLLLVACAPSVGDDGRGAAEEQLVYRPLLSDRFEYRRVNYPEQVDALLVLADTPVVFDATRTEVYFWPITREYLADFARLDEPVDARLEVVSSDGDERVVVPHTYVLWYPNGVAAGESELLIDEVARDRHATYVRDAREAAEATIDYQRRLAEHETALQEYLQAEAGGVEPLPEPPDEFTEQPPEQYLAYARDPAEAPIVSLPAGEYTIRLRTEDGEVVNGSERRLISFAPRRDGVGYAIVPERRWTQPTINFDPDETIYVTGAGDVYLQPVEVEEYPASLYARLLDPQTIDAPDPSEYVWVPREPVTGAELLIRSGDEVVDRVPQSAYRVQQVSGASRGYTIEPYDPEDAPLEADFEAMRVPIDDASVTGVTIARGGEPIPSSARAVRRTPSAPDWVVYAPALLPILVVALIRALPRRRPG